MYYNADWSTLIGVQFSSRAVNTPVVPARCYASAGTSYGPVSVSVCLSVSVTSRCSIETVERIWLFFGMGASFHLSYTVL